MWYAKAIDLSAPGVLTIRADDGRTLYINREAHTAAANNDFPVDTVGHLAITPRVEQCHGRRVAPRIVFHERTIQTIQRTVCAAHPPKRLMEKVRLLAVPVEGVFEKMERAIQQNDEASWTAAEDILKPYPYFTGPWLQWNDAQRMTVSLELDGDLPVELRLQLKGDRWPEPMIQKGKKVSFCPHEPIARYGLFLHR